MKLYKSKQRDKKRKQNKYKAFRDNTALHFRNISRKQKQKLLGKICMKKQCG